MLGKRRTIFVAVQLHPRLLYFVDFITKLLYYPLKAKVMTKRKSTKERNEDSLRRYVNDR